MKQTIFAVFVILSGCSAATEADEGSGETSQEVTACVPLYGSCLVAGSVCCQPDSGFHATCQTISAGRKQCLLQH
jgi:hypothetical protein